MIHIKALFIVGALFYLSLASANPLQCQDCLGDALLKDIESYDKHRHCWYDKLKNVLHEVKIYSADALVGCIKTALESNNKVVEEKCIVDVPDKPCSRQDNDAFFECKVQAMKELGKAYRKQEQCHGQDFKSEDMRIAAVLIRAANTAWSVIHPEC